MNKTMTELQQEFRQLRLAETAEELPKLLRQAEQSSWTYQEFLEELTAFELKKREAKSIEKRLKYARFPYLKPLSEFDLEAQQALTKRQLTQLEELQWLE